MRITRYPQRDFARLVERIRQRKADGWTALYDALGTYLDGADSQDGRKVMVMYTDGGDTRSALSLPETMTLLKASHVTVYAIGLVENTGSARPQLQMTLRQLTEATGGQAFFPTAMKDVESAYDKVLAEIKGQYHLGYASTQHRHGRRVAQGRHSRQAARPARPLAQGLLWPLQTLLIGSRSSDLGFVKEPIESARSEIRIWYDGVLRHTHPCLPSPITSTSHPTSSFAATRSMPCPSWSTA